MLTTTEKGISVTVPFRIIGNSFILHHSFCLDAMLLHFYCFLLLSTSATGGGPGRGCRPTPRDSRMGGTTRGAATPAEQHKTVSFVTVLTPIDIFHHTVLRQCIQRKQRVWRRSPARQPPLFRLDEASNRALTNAPDDKRPDNNRFLVHKRAKSRNKAHCDGLSNVHPPYSPMG